MNKEFILKQVIANATLEGYIFTTEQILLLQKVITDKLSIENALKRIREL